VYALEPEENPNIISLMPATSYGQIQSVLLTYGLVKKLKSHVPDIVSINKEISPLLNL
jgi:hypothetical protein